MSELELSKEGAEAKRSADAIMEMERKILDFLEQQHPDYLVNNAVHQAIQSISFKISNRAFW